MCINGREYANKYVKYECTVISDVTRNGIHRPQMMMMMLDDNDDDSSTTAQFHRLSWLLGQISKNLANLNHISPLITLWVYRLALAFVRDSCDSCWLAVCSSFLHSKVCRGDNQMFIFEDCNLGSPSIVSSLYAIPSESVHTIIFIMSTPNHTFMF